MSGILENYWIWFIIGALLFLFILSKLTSRPWLTIRQAVYLAKNNLKESSRIYINDNPLTLQIYLENTKLGIRYTFHKDESDILYETLDFRANDYENGYVIYFTNGHITRRKNMSSKFFPDRSLDTESIYELLNLVKKYVKIGG